MSKGISLLAHLLLRLTFSQNSLTQHIVFGHSWSIQIVVLRYISPFFEMDDIFIRWMDIWNYLLHAVVMPVFTDLRRLRESDYATQLADSHCKVMAA